MELIKSDQKRSAYLLKCKTNHASLNICLQGVLGGLAVAWCSHSRELRQICGELRLPCLGPVTTHRVFILLKVNQL